jgi:hypothetical protein
MQDRVNTNFTDGPFTPRDPVPSLIDRKMERRRHWRSPSHPDFLLSNMKLVDGLAANSASPSDIWIMKDRNTGHEYVFKTFVDSMPKPSWEKIEVHRKARPGYDEKNSNPGLRYEQRVYQAVDEITTRTGVPFFVRSVAVYRSLKYNHLETMYRTKSKPGAEVPDANLTALTRNYAWTECGQGNRPSILNDTDTLPPQCQVYAPHIKSMRFGLTVTVLKQETQTLKNWLNTSKANGLDKIAVLFQIFCATFLLHDNSIVHNDLHFGNILLETLPAPVATRCTMHSLTSHPHSVAIHSWTVVSRFRPLMYDYDLAQMGSMENSYLKLTRSCTHDDRIDLHYLLL